MTDPQFKYGAYCRRCNRGIRQDMGALTGHNIWIRCRECGTPTPAYQCVSPRQVQNNRENGEANT